MRADLTLSLEHSGWMEAVRKIPCDIAAAYNVVSVGSNIAFEYRRNGECLSRKIRKEVVKGDVVSKTFWFDPPLADLGIEKFLWNEDCLKEPASLDVPLIITEGEFDALSFLAAGALFAVSVPNGNTNKPGVGAIDPHDDQQFSYLWQDGKLRPDLARFNKIILAVDNDKVGQILREELAIRLGRHKCWFVEYPDGCKDANDVLRELGPDGITDLIADAKPMVPDRLVKFSEIPSNDSVQPLGSGWADFDHHFRLVPPQLIIVTGRPNAGKSQWVLSLTANWARLHGIKIALLQFEDDPNRNRKDLLSYAKAWLNQEKGGIHEDPASWVDRMYRTICPNESLDEDADFNLDWMLGTIEEAATRHGVKVVVIDPWNEIEHMWGRQDTEASYLNRALKQLRRVSRRYKIAIIVVTHPTKEGASRTSVEDFTLRDISGGQAWDNKADLGVVVWADDVGNTMRHIKVAKSKNFTRMGVPGIVRKQFNPATSSYTVIGKGI